MKGLTSTAASDGFSHVPTFCVRDCGRDYSRDVVPLSTAVREANRRNLVLPRVVRPGGSRQAYPWGSIGITDNNWVAFLAQQPGIDEVNLTAKRDRMAGLTK
jgi:hypothetical protein